MDTPLGVPLLTSAGWLTGQATDPNTGPLLILLAAAYWPLRRARRVRQQ